MAATAAAGPTLTVRARADVAGGVGALMTVIVDDISLGTVEVTATSFANYPFSAPGLKPRSKVEVVYTNDGRVNGVDRNLYLSYLSDGTTVLQLNSANAIVDRGAARMAFDSLDVLPWGGCVCWFGAMRMVWPTVTPDAQWAQKVDAVRFLQQATFGPTTADVNALLGTTYANWISAQMALPYAPNYQNYVWGKYSQGDAYRPRGANYTTNWIQQKFWERATSAPDQLRARTAFALHQIFMVSLADSNQYYHGRAYANYVDLLHKNAFGNFRTLLQDMALSPSMGIYLSHMRNRKEDAATGRMPDENFAREVMQLFTIGLHELNIDGTPKRDGFGNPVETYTNADVLALAKVFTGWSWAFPDSKLNEQHFLWESPSTTAANDPGIDVLPMKAYPAFHSTAQKKFFAGKPWATTLPAGNSAQADLKATLDVLFNHPNVGPFIGRQLIQHLVTSHPSTAYVGRVAAVFNNNGSGVRGDLGAVVRAVLLDTEARSAPTATAGKLREPVQRLTHWMRAMGAKSASGEYTLQWALEDQGQRAMAAPSVFGYFRPGYIPANTAFSTRGATAPEFQIINETTVASWLNMAEAMAGSGLGWNVSANDVVATYASQVALAKSTNLTMLPDQINLMLLGGRMTPALRQQIVDIMSQIDTASAEGALSRARAAVFLALASPEYMYQP
ncbi:MULTISPECIES: DUF1800 family protein [unclassified Roseateles]|uniref:DUF1800 family protein n=1 Tax=unclassified Roseateles TaxID=2626991 RepID=UPI0006FA2E7E|nr:MULTISPECIES: DUF1800 family protein [unclassified Roseateles]